MKLQRFFAVLRDSASELDAARAVVSGDAAAHLHLAVASKTSIDGPVRYSALPPRRVTAIYPAEGRVVRFEEDTSAVAGALRHDLALFTTRLAVIDAPSVAALSREAVLAQLLAEGGLAIALAGAVLKVAGSPPIDADHVREILKAARLGDRFQPLLELIDTI